MASRDVEINLIAHDRTGRGTKSAARNLEQLARKAENIKTKTTIDSNVDTSKLDKTFGAAGDKASKAFSLRFRRGIRNLGSKVLGSELGAQIRKTMGQQGRRGGTAFVAGFIKVVSFGQIGGGFAQSAIRAAPKFASAGRVLGGAVAAVMVLEITQAVGALSSLFVGGGLLAAPIAFLLVKQAKAAKETEKQEKRIATIRKNLNNATNKDTRARLQKQLAAEERIFEELKRQSQQWDTLKARAASFMNFISAPLKLPLEKALTALYKGFNDLKKPVADVMTQLGTALPGLTGGAMGFLLSMINALKPALPNIVAGLQSWARVMPQIGNSVGNFLAQLTSHPEAVQGFADSFDTFLGTAGDVIGKLQAITTEYARFEALIRGGRTGQWGDEWTKVGGKVGVAAQKIGQSQLFILRKYDDMLQGIESVPGSPFQKLKDETHAQRLAMEAEFAAVTTAKKDMDAAISGQPTVADVKADITDFQAKIIIAEKRLKTIKGAKARAKVELDIASFKVGEALARHKLNVLNKVTSKPKLRADKKNLEAALAEMNRKLKKLNGEKPTPQIRAEKRAAEAAIRQVTGMLNQLDGKEANIWIKTHRVTYYGTRGKIPTNPKAGSGAPGSSFTSWSAGQNASLDGGGMSRTDPPRIVIGAPEVSTRVFIDSREITAVVRSTVVDENNRRDARARVGRRR